MTRSEKQQSSSFGLPLVVPILGGLVVTAVVYGAILAGPLDNPWTRRFLLGHWVCVATVALFATAAWGLMLKLYLISRQQKSTALAVDSLRGLVVDTDAVEPSERARWLAQLWKSQPSFVLRSWFGQRVSELVARQSKRNSGESLDEDLRDLATRDADRQYESYGLIRIAIWAMPMLGFLGTVLGISSTLGNMDTELLATQSQKAMDQLTAGLYVAFDTTALALVLTVVAMFIQFGVNRTEQGLLSQIDREMDDQLMGFLVAAPTVQGNSDIAHWKQLSADLIESMHQLVVQQANIWKQTINEAHSRWTNLTGQAGDQVQSALTEAFDASLVKHAQFIAQVQREGADQIDARWQQWQLALSDQARGILAQQKEMARQSELLSKLLTATTDLQKLEVQIQSNMQQVTQVDRFHDAAICLTEAVAVLASEMERSGFFQGRLQVRRAPVDDVAVEEKSKKTGERRGKAA